VHAALERLFVHMPCGPTFGSIPHPNHFAGVGVRGFLHGCGALAARDLVRVFQLEIVGLVVARGSGSWSATYPLPGFDPECPSTAS
jgi:hypothetical protein